jgi:hypothetical protein
VSVSERRLFGTRCLPVGLVLFVLLSGAALGQGAPAVASHGARPVSALGVPVGSIDPAAFTPINTTLTVNASSVNLSNAFWGTTVNNEVHMLRGEATAVNATPVRTLVWPGAMAGEDYDPFTNTHYDTYSGVGKTALTSEAQFVQMCKAIHCIAIMQVPAEIDNATFAAKIVNYTESNLSFKPAYWMIGNEPELWYHWQEPWKDWPNQYSTGPTPTQFGNEVLAYVKAMRAFDNTTPILGLPASGCTCGSWTFEQWIYGVLKVTGPKIQAVAFHEYPAGWLGTGDGSLHDFYGTIQSAAGIPQRMIGARAAVQSGCPGCNVSVFISEIGSALSWSAYGQYADAFSGALSLASQMTQAMDDNLTNVDLFATELQTYNSWFDPRGDVRPDYPLYTQVLNHLGNHSFSVNLTGLDHTLYGIDTIAPQDQGRRDLLVVNDNITHSVAFTPRFAGAPGSAPVELWSWNGSIHTNQSNSTTWVEPYTPNPVPHQYPDGLPGRYVLPPQSMVLFEMYPSGSSYVQVVEHGVPLPAPWYASVGSSFYGTTENNISLLLPTGAYPVSSVPISLPIGGRELNATERLAPFAASPAPVSGPSSTISIGFVPQWRVFVNATPSTAGSAAPDVGWWNDSQPLNLTAGDPASGFAFDRWSGWGPGSYSGPGRSATIYPSGPVVEKARYIVGFPVHLQESGLPAHTPWSISIRGFTSEASSNALTVFEPAGTWGFTVSTVPGYRSVPHNSSFTVGVWGLWTSIEFVPITPAPPVFSVTFAISGLPASTPVSVTVRNSTQFASGGIIDPQFALSNGSYAYQVGYVAGFHPDVPTKTFAVAGGPMTVDLQFVTTTYPVIWVAMGTRAGMNWTVQLDGQSQLASSAWLSTPLPNGTYPYTIGLPSNYSSTPRTGLLGVTGAATTVALTFTPVLFATVFEGTGLGGSSPWSVRLGDQSQSAQAGRTSFLAANGSYTFDVHAPFGYYADPSHGVVAVAGPIPPTHISFHLSSLRPSAALVASLTSGALSVSIWFGVSIVAGYASFSLLRRRGG